MEGNGPPILLEGRSRKQGCFRATVCTRGGGGESRQSLDSLRMKEQGRAEAGSHQRNQNQVRPGL